MSDHPATVLVETSDDLFVVEVGAGRQDDTITSSEADRTLPPRPRPVELVPSWAMSQLIDVDSSGSTIALLLDRRPPLLVSHDRGSTWTERGGGLARGRALALGENPDHMVLAARNRLYVSTDGGLFWRSLDVELPEIRDIGWGAD